MPTPADPASGAGPPVVFTIGHSTHPIEVFLRLLEAHGVRQVADVRTVPRSRRHPQFGSEALEQSLGDAGLGYRHFAALGGLRKPRRDSVNTAWRTPGFRGYADHMQGDDFWQGVSALLTFAGAAPTAVMCAEALWWQCHRRLLADALSVQGVPVRHILPAGQAKPHELSDFARPEGRGVIYPGLL
jgi:uncharacterized protein (DUF488 family)